MIRAGGLGWFTAVAGLAAGVLLIITELFPIRFVITKTATCQDLAPQHLKDSCLVIGHESHVWGLAVLGLLVLVMTFGAVVGGSRPAAIAILAAGAVALGITLLHDLPQTTKTGGVGADYASAHGHAGTGFWLEVVGSTLALACGAFLTLLRPEPLGPRLRAVRAGEEGTGPPAAAPPDAEEPASA